MRLAVVCKDGQLHLFEHFLNGWVCPSCIFSVWMFELFKTVQLSSCSFFFFPLRVCKKPLSPVCSLQVSTMKGDSPVPVPLLAAALCADRQNLVLVYGNHLQPVIETTVSTAETYHWSKWVIQLVNYLTCRLFLQPFNTSERHACLVRDLHATLSLSVETAVSKVRSHLCH